jgi:TolB-like protein
MEERDMKLKASILVLAFACLSAAAAAAPKVAVLDAVLPEKMDINVAIGVTEKISEELVGSGRFTVLDRTTVGQSLKEIEFQMSGMVSDEQIKKAGEQLNSRLGAAYVVVSRVSVVGETYFVTAKMIDIKTGEITAQASSEQEGKVAITLKIAQVVGKKLAGGVKEPAAVVTTELAEEKPPVEKQTSENASAKAVAPKPALRSRIVAYYTAPVFSGEAVDMMDAYIGPSSSVSSAAFSLHWLQFLFKGFYVSASATASDSSVDWYDLYSVLNSNTYYATVDVQAGVGWGFSLGKLGQMYAGIQAGALYFALEDAWYVWMTPAEDSQFGICATAELGYDLVLFRALSLSARASYTMTSFPSGGSGYFFYTTDSHPVSFEYLGLSVGVGWAY